MNTIRRAARSFLPMFAFLSIVLAPLHGDDDPHATGLIPPSEETIAWERTHMRVPKKIAFNALGLQRLNVHRAARGQAPLAGAPFAANVGEEITDSVLLGDYLDTREGAAPSALPADLPTSVDNSVLNYFPPIGSQGSIGSCAQWAAIYYTLTHMTAMARGWDAKNGGAAFRLSPKFTYNILNNGNADNGSFFTDGFDIALKHGVATWAEWPYDADFRSWPITSTVWKNAINVRAATSGYVRNLNTSTGLDQLKTLLVNGYVLSFGTYINSWQFTTIKDDPSTTADAAFVGKQICRYLNGSNGAHGMTIVGYNDAVWTDVNSNGVVDPGEKGALRIANSWGTGWYESGFTWLAYDALQTVSAVPGGPSSNRVPAFMGYCAYWITARSSYTPTVLAEFTLNHAKRRQISLTLGQSDPGTTSPTATLYPRVLNYTGGNYAFNGSAMAVDGTFVLDFSDLAPVLGQKKRWYLNFRDTESGNPLLVKDFRWKDTLANTQVVWASAPLTLDLQTSSLWVDAVYADGTQDSVAPTVSFTAPSGGSAVSGQVTLSVTTGDNVAVSGVDFFVDGNFLLTKTSAPYSTVWDSVSSSSGVHALMATAFDRAGNQASHSITVNTPVQTDVSAPSITILQPSQGAFLNGTVDVTVAATDDRGITHYGLFVDGIPTESDGGISFPFSWNTDPLSPGSHDLVVEAYDAAGNKGSDTRTITVQGTPDTTPPQVYLLSPQNNANVSGSVVLSAGASDDRGTVSSVQFFVDGVSIGTDVTSPFSTVWTATGLPVGSSHTLTATAKDPANNAASSSISVRIVSPSDTQAPSVALTSPANGATVSGSVTLTATANDNVGLAGVDFLLDGVSLRYVSAGPQAVFSTSWNSLTSSSGAHTLMARAYDGSGNTGSHSITVNVNDVSPPSVPGTPAGELLGNQIRIDWAASSDPGSGVASYNIYRDQVLRGQSDVPSFVDGILAWGTDVSYAVSAVNGAGLESALSNPVVVSIPEQQGEAVHAIGYPNPVRGEKHPTLRVSLRSTESEVTSIDVTIYDRTGRVVHSASVPALPVANIEGETVFEYPWTDPVPSGHYDAVIRLHHGGSTTRAKTSFTVLR